MHLYDHHVLLPKEIVVTRLPTESMAFGIETICMVYKGRLVKVEFRMVLATIDKNLIFQLASFSRLSPINPFSVFSSSSHASMVHLDTPLNLKSTEPGIINIWRV